MSECNVSITLVQSVPSYTLETQVFSLLVGLITVMCIILNTVGIYAFMRLPRTPSSMVYLHLCITDLIVGVFVTPYSIVILRQNLKSTNHVYCILQGIMFEISYTTTLFILTYISLDRLLALYQPLKYKKLMSARAVFWINLGTWIVPVIRPIVRYIMKGFTDDSPCADQYGYNNDDYFMVCYNTDYIAFVKGDGDILKMLDLCIVVVACQLATFVCSVLVMARLSHRLHTKRSTHRATSRRKSAAMETCTTAYTQKITPLKTYHVHDCPPDDISTVHSKDGQQDTAEKEQDDSVDSGPQKRKRKELEQHAIVTMVMVIVFFMLTYTPSFICFIVPGIYTMAKENDQLWIFLVVDYCTFINSTFLPMVHFSRSAGFKKQLNSIKVSTLRLIGIEAEGQTHPFSVSINPGLAMKNVCTTECNEDNIAQALKGKNHNTQNTISINSERTINTERTLNADKANVVITSLQKVVPVTDKTTVNRCSDQNVCSMNDTCCHEDINGGFVRVHRDTVNSCLNKVGAEIIGTPERV